MRPLRVDFVMPYPQGRAPGQRFRVEQWLRLLPDSALEAHFLPLLTHRAYERLYEPGAALAKVGFTAAGAARRLRHVARRSTADVTFVYREAFPFGPPVFERLIARGTPLVYDFDDAIYLPAASRVNSKVARLKRPLKTVEIVRRSTITTVGNRHLHSWAAQHGSDVRILPTTLDIERYQPRVRARPPGQRLRVGWSGSPTTAEHLLTIEPALRRMLRELDIELVVYGAPGFRLAGADRVHVRPWSAETEVAEVSAFDVGLMPLPDDEWSRGKCGFKALLYMSLGVPVVLSPVAANRDIVTHGENGLWASTLDEWFDAVARLQGDPQLRQELGAAGRQTVVDCYSGQRWSTRFLETLTEAASA